MTLRKGFNPANGGYSAATLATLTPDQKTLFNAEGLYLDGTPPAELPELESEKWTIPQTTNSTTAAAPQEASIPLSQLDSFFEKKKAEWLAENTPKQTAKAPARVEMVSTDVLQGLEDWEIKDRVYILVNNTKPVSYNLRTRHKQGSPLMYYDPLMQLNRPMRFTSSHPSMFIDKQGDQSVLVERITIIEGMLVIPAHDVTKQKFLHIHPDNGTVFKELDTKADADKALELDELLNRARSVVRAMGSDKQSAVARIMCREFKDNWDSSTMKIELFAEVDKSPQKFIKLAEDPTIIMKGIVKTAQHRGYIRYENFQWVETNGGKTFLSVSPGVNELDAIVVYLTSGEGTAFYEYLQNAIG